MKHSQSEEIKLIGQYQVFELCSDGSEKIISSGTNTIMVHWGFLIYKTLFANDPTHRIIGAYIEYKNVANPSDTVSVPSYNKFSPISYYQSLPADCDCLRVPINGTPTVDIAPGYEPYFSSGQGNRVTVTFQTTNANGHFKGLPFSHMNNSKIYGYAILAMPNQSNSNQDILFARAYFNPADQVLKPAASHIGIRWRCTFL